MLFLEYFKAKNLIPTLNQETAIKHIQNFIDPENNDWIYILKGYAGTGKTTLVAALVDFLKTINYTFYLMAPTGRAAKVLQQYSGFYASTIHRKIYRKKAFPGGGFNFVLANNTAENCLFIVDEASMIGAKSEGLSGHSFLHDLLDYISNGVRCKVLFVGDTAQLPPIGSTISPALNPSALQEFSLNKVGASTLTQVLRQELNSGILYNATLIREVIISKVVKFLKFNLQSFQDIKAISGHEVQEYLEQAYNHYGMEETIIICRSNKIANRYNQQIRNRIMYFEEEVSGGDWLMVVKNNYTWINPDEKVFFLANGEMIQIKRIAKETHLYGFTFFDVEVELKDHPDTPVLDIRIFKESLHADGPALSETQINQLAQAVEQDYLDINDKKLRLKKILENNYYNAVQVKFGYAITGHKSQGGQWDCVFIDQSFFSPENFNMEYLRWLYTALTRAKKQVYLVNFHQNFL